MVLAGSVSVVVAEHLRNFIQPGAILGQGREKIVYSIPGTDDVVLLITRERTIDDFVERRVIAARHGLPLSPFIAITDRIALAPKMLLDLNKPVWEITIGLSSSREERIDRFSDDLKAVCPKRSDLNQLLKQAEQIREALNRPGAPPIWDGLQVGIFRNSTHVLCLYVYDFRVWNETGQIPPRVARSIQTTRDSAIALCELIEATIAKVSGRRR